jgi:hypothetical protein
MYVSTLSVIATAELSILAIATSIGLFLHYRKKQKTWKSSICRIRNKIKQLKNLRNKYSIVKHHLHQIAAKKQALEHEVKRLKAETNGSSEALEAKINELNDILAAKEQELTDIKDQMKSQMDDLDNDSSDGSQYTLESEMPGDIDLFVEIDDETATTETTNKVADETVNEDIKQLKVLNEQQKEKISALRDKLSALSNSSEQPSQPEQLKQMLNESETCINMLEDELTVVTNTLNEKSESIQALTAANQTLEKQLHSIQNSSSETHASDNAPANGQETIDALNKQLNDAMAMSMTMMTVSGDQSNIISFARNSISCTDIESLAEAVLEVVKIYGLQGAVQLRGRNGNTNKSNLQTLSHNSKQLMEDTTNTDRFLQSDAALVIRFDNMSLLLEGMPQSDQEAYSRYKDSLAVVMELASDHMQTIEDGNVLQQQQVVLKKIISTTQTTIKKVEQKAKYQAKQSKLIIDSMSDVLGDPSFVNKMDETFKPVFEGIVNETKERFDKLHAQSQAVDQSFAKIINELSKRI